MKTFTQVIDGLVVVMLNISLWQGRKKLRPEDLEEKGISIASLPPEKLASLGSKRIVAPDAINGFMALKRRAERACLSVGVRFLGGYAVPEDSMPSLQAELDEIAVEFEKEKAAFLSTYEATVNDWADENQEWREAIKRAIDSPAHVGAQLQCSYTALRVTPAKGAEQTLDTQVNGLKGQLEREIALAAKIAWEDSFQGKLSVRKSALNRLDAINEKLAGLSFIDGSIGALNNAVTTVLDQCKGKAVIEGTDLMTVCGILATLIGLDHIRFSTEAEAAESAATAPISEPEEQSEPAVAEQPSLALQETAAPDTAPAQPASTIPPAFSKPAIRVEGLPGSTDLSFGRGPAETAIPIAPPPAAATMPQVWF